MPLASGIHPTRFTGIAATAPVGPGAPSVGGAPTAINVNTAGVGLLWVPGWNFLGATYDAVLVQPIANADTGVPVNTMKRGVHNTFVVPAELSGRGETPSFTVAGCVCPAIDEISENERAMLYV